MKYAHLADLHLGSWREDKMRELSTTAFLTAIDHCIKQDVDFILFAGDLFNTSLPSLDTLKIVTKKLKELKDQKINLYAIAGSHDFSPSGKTMLDVLENAGLLVNVCKGQVDEQTHQLKLKFTIDHKTEAKITGMLGKRGMLDRTYYENLQLDLLEQEPGYKIFMFHTTLTELKPKHLERLESQPLSFLPKRFNYYAGGHIHHPAIFESAEYGTLSYPGALFPNNFSELEEYGKGGYNLITIEDNNQNNNQDYNQNNNQKVQWVPLEIIKHHKIEMDCEHRSPQQVNLELQQLLQNIDVKDKLVTIRLTGKIINGIPSDIDMKSTVEQLYAKEAYFVMKNSSGLESEEFGEIKIASTDAEHVEEDIIKEHLQQNKIFEKETEFQLIKSLIQLLNTSKKEGETVADFTQRIESEINKILVV